MCYDLKSFRTITIWFSAIYCTDYLQPTDKPLHFSQNGCATMFRLLNEVEIYLKCMAKLKSVNVLVEIL